MVTFVCWTPDLTYYLFVLCIQHFKKNEVEEHCGQCCGSMMFFVFFLVIKTLQHTWPHLPLTVIQDLDILNCKLQLYIEPEQYMNTDVLVILTSLFSVYKLVNQGKILETKRERKRSTEVKKRAVCWAAAGTKVAGQ